MREILKRVGRRRVWWVAPYPVVICGAIGVAAILLVAPSLSWWSITLVGLFLFLCGPAVLALARNLVGSRAMSGVEPMPSPASWQRAHTLLNDALELEPNARDEFLRRECAGDSRMCREVRSLMDAALEDGPLDRLSREAVSPAVAQLLPALGAPGGAATPHASEPLLRFPVPPRYEHLERLGSGGMGVVYKARDIRLGRVVALKFLSPALSAEQSAKERFLLEARAAAALEHPNICTVHEIGESEDGGLFIAMPLYGGETVKAKIARGALPVEAALDVALQVARGLAHAHQGGIVHRDIKPANLVLTAEGVVKIVDFGVAKLAGLSLTNSGMTPGTLPYMSPEQVQGEEVDGRTDVWSLAVVLYEMLTGERPFRGSHGGALLHAILTAEPRPIASLRPGVSPALEQVVMRALAKRPEDRFRTARDMADALEAIRGRDGGQGSGPGGPVSPSPGIGAAPDSGETPVAILPEGERRQATIVSAALSGFDAMVERLVPQEVEEMLVRLREDAAEVAARHGGSLNHLVGEELVLLFGIPATHEDDGVRAVRAALELRERVRALSARVESHEGEPLRLHVGIDTGWVVARDGDGGERAYRIAGAPAQLAARLAAQAGSDEIWVSAECHHRIAPFFEAAPKEPVAVRGRKQPLVPFSVLGESGLQTRLEAAERVGLSAYTGREPEMATLGRCLADATRGEGQLVSVTGEAGMGKSRLLHEFRQSSRDDRSIFLLGRCQSYGSAVAYLPFIEILRTGIGLGDGGAGASPERAIQRIREIAPELEEFVPLYLHLLSISSPRHPVPKHLQGDAFRLAIQEALAAILTASARQRPLVVLLEDWHWADEGSQAVLKGLSEVVSGYPILVVVTSRPGYGVDLGDPGQHTSIRLQPLEPSCSAEILRSLLRVNRFPEELGLLLHERTGGNPFFLEEVCQALVEEGSIRVEGGEARLTGPLQMLDLPDSVQAVIRARLDRLDRHARDVLRLASVAGREFSRRILQLTLPEQECVPLALESLKTAGLIQQMRVGRESAYRFKHILTQEVAYGSLLEHQRRDLHGRVGTAIEHLHAGQIEEHLDRLAHHFSRAEIWEKAVHYGLRSAERTGELAQFMEALQTLEQTQRWLAKLPPGPERRDIQIKALLRQERLCETLGLRLRQQQIIDELISLLDPAGDQEELAEVYLRQGDLFTLLRRFDEAEEALDRSLDIRCGRGDSDGERNTLRSLGLLRWYQGRNEEALDFVQQTIRIDRERRDLVGIVGDLTNLGAILRGLGEYDGARAALEEALELSESASAEGEQTRLEDELSIKRMFALQHLANHYRERGDRARALEYYHRAGNLAREKRLPIQLSYHYTAVAHVHLLDGDIEKSLEFYREAVDLTRKAKYAPGLAHSLRILGEVLLGLNRNEESLRNLEEAATVFAQLKDPEDEAVVWSKIATAREHQEDYARAVPAWSKAAALRRQMRDAAGELEALEGLGRTTRRQEAETYLALEHFQRALELSLELQDRAAEGRLRNTIGILEWERGEYALALQHYERAFALFQELGDFVHAGLMLNSVAVTLKAMRRWEEARRHLEEAVELNRRTGQRQFEGHALAALGDVVAEIGDTETAEEHYRRSLQIRREIGDRRGEGWMLQSLARSGLLNGRAERAWDLLDQAGRIAEECGDTDLAGACERLRRTPAY